jgi:hypothetical protein
MSELQIVSLNKQRVRKSLFPSFYKTMLNPLNAKLNPICHLLALLGAHHILHVSRVKVKLQKTNS